MFTEKQLCRSLFFDKVVGLKFKNGLGDYHWVTIYTKYPLLVTLTSPTKMLPLTLVILL